MPRREPTRPNFFNEQFTSGQTRTFDFTTLNYRTLSLFVSARDDGGGPGDDMTINVYIRINGFYVLHPVAKAGTVKMNELFIFTNEDVHGPMRVEIIAGGNPPSDGVDIEVWGWNP